MSAPVPAPEAAIVIQEQQLGTGHAMRMVIESLGVMPGTVVVTYGDMPLLRGRTLSDLARRHAQAGNAVTVLTARGEFPGFGRIVRDAGGAFLRIVEERDASDAERAIDECNSGCYDPSFAQLGGATVDGTYASLLELPYLSDQKANPALDKVITDVGGASNFNNNAFGSFVMALLFQDAVQKVVASGQTLDRAALFNVLNNDEHSFNAQGTIGATDISGHVGSQCQVLVQLQKGVWTRVFPTGPGTFDCSPNNVSTLKLAIS